MLDIKAKEFVPSNETLEKIKNEKVEFEKKIIKMNKWLLDMIEEETEEEIFKNEFDEFDGKEIEENKFEEYKDFDECKKKEDRKDTYSGVLKNGLN